MKGNGNSFGTLFRKFWFSILPTSGQRTKYLRKHADLFHSVGENLFWQPRKFPADPEYISLGNNVKVAANVIFVNHDPAFAMLNCKYGGSEFKPLRGCIQVGDNVVIGTNVIILPDVKIGSNVVIGAGAIVTRDIPDNSVAGGVPCRVLGSFEDFVEKRRGLVSRMGDDLWADFNEKRK